MDYEALAKKYGGTPTIDYSSLAKQFGGTPNPTPPVAPVLSSTEKFRNAGHNLIGGVVNALTSSEQALGANIAGAIGGNSTDVTKQNQALSDSDLSYVKTIIQGRQKALKNGQDTTHYDNLIKNYRASNGQTLSELYPSLDKTKLQVIGDSAGVLLDILSAGTYGKAGAETGKLLTATEKAAQPVAKQTLKQTLQTIGVKTAERAGIGAGTGYGYDVSQNLQQGKTGGEIFKPGMGTIAGGTIPVIIGGVQAGVALTKETAPRFINSLIKPKQSDFSYGKDPGRTVSEMGITGNNINDFSNNIHTARKDIGTQIGDIYSSPLNANVKINANDEIAKIDEAIKNAAKGGKENQGIVTTLQNTKDALLYEHGIDAEGNIIKTGNVPRDLSALSPQEAFDLKQLVSGQTKFTGKPSDDKTVNSVLKDIYGGLKEKLNNAVSPNNPEIIDLNQKYADLTSAEIATRNREAIINRSNMVSLPQTITGLEGTIAALVAGTAALPATLIGISVAGLEKALATTAVKTRIAAWLGSESPSVISKVLQQNPGIKTVLYRLMPKLASKLGEPTK